MPKTKPKVLKPYTGEVYFIADLTQQKVKIGYSTNVKQRLKNLQTGYPNTLTILKTIPGNVAEERKYQALFCWSKINREWFILSEDILEFINRNSA